MLKMNKRNHGYKDIDRLIEKTLIKREKFYKRWKDVNTSICNYSFKQLTENLLIQSEEILIDDFKSEYTNIFDIRTGKVICISGISTLDIKEIPTDKSMYAV